MRTIGQSPYAVVDHIRRSYPSSQPAITRVKPTTLLKLEAAVVLVGTLFGYSHVGSSWWLFAALFLVPDLFMLGYLRNNKIGALVYNIGHTYLIPLPLALVSWTAQWDLSTAIALIWTAHIAFDRLLGFGLKSERGFKHTHLDPSD